MGISEIIGSLVVFGALFALLVSSAIMILVNPLIAIDATYPKMRVVRILT
jgi:hypothetical protein